MWKCNFFDLQMNQMMKDVKRKDSNKKKVCCNSEVHGWQFWNNKLSKLITAFQLGRHNNKLNPENILSSFLKVDFTTTRMWMHKYYVKKDVRVIMQLIDSLCRDNDAIPIVCVHVKACSTCKHLCLRTFWNSTILHQCFSLNGIH